MRYKPFFILSLVLNTGFILVLLLFPSVLNINVEIASKVFALLATGTALIVSAFGYFLNADAETRLSQANKVENDIKLIKSFSEIMDIAHSRAGTHFSEKMVELLLQDLPRKTPHDLIVISLLKPQIEKLVSFNQYHGAAAQEAAITAIYELGIQHITLKNMALQGLKSLSEVMGEEERPAILAVLS